MEYFIYKLINNETKKVYYGYTSKNLSIRLNQHKYDYNRFIKGKSKKFLSSYYVLYPDPISVDILLLEKCNNIYNARIIEGGLIENNICVNINSSGYLNRKFNLLKNDLKLLYKI